MKDKESVSSHEIAACNSSATTSTSNAKNKCSALFRSCFGGSIKRESLENIVEEDVKEYDYVVEKLIVKRVPFILFPTQEKTLGCNTSTSSKDASHSLTNTMHNASSETQSLLYYSGQFDQIMPLLENRKCLHLDTNAVVLNERNRNYMLSTDYYARLTEIMKTMSSLHPDLKENERFPKDPCPLNVPKNRNDENQEQKVFQSEIFKSKPFVKEKELQTAVMKPNKEQKIYNLTLDNLQHCYTCKSENSPVQDISCNSTNCIKPIIDAIQMNIKNDNNQINHCLPHVHKPSINESRISKKYTDSSNTILKWKIIVKNYKSKIPQSPKNSQKIVKYFETC